MQQSFNHSSKLHDDNFNQSNSSKKKKKTHSGTIGSGSNHHLGNLNTSGHEKSSANMFQGRSGPQGSSQAEFSVGDYCERLRKEFNALQQQCQR